LNVVIVNLVKLQKLDTNIKNLKKLQEEGPKKLAEVEAEIQAAEKRVADSLALEKEMNKRRRELEVEVEDIGEKIKQNQARQLRVKTNEEYRALLKENEYLRKSNAQREDEILELMEKIEKITVENKSLKVWLEEQKKILAEKKKNIETWLLQCRKDQDRMDAERPGLLQGVPENYLTLYQRLYNGRNGRAVVPILNGICQECHLQIPPQQFNELQRNDKLMTCPHCDRIIFWQSHEDFLDL